MGHNFSHPSSMSRPKVWASLFDIRQGTFAAQPLRTWQTYQESVAILQSEMIRTVQAFCSKALPSLGINSWMPLVKLQRLGNAWNIFNLNVKKPLFLSRFDRSWLNVSPSRPLKTWQSLALKRKKRVESTWWNMSQNARKLNPRMGSWANVPFAPSGKA